MPTIPAWCAPPPSLLGRDPVRAQALAALQEGPICLIGAAGVGTTTAAGAVLRDLCDQGACDHLAAVPVDASTSRADLVLSLGLALDAALPGDETSVLEALARPRTAVLLDDADLAPEAVRHVVTLSPATTWILTGRDPLLGSTVPVPPLPHDLIAELVPDGRDPTVCRGRPLLARLPEGIEPDEDWSTSLLTWVADLPLLADLPTGIPAPLTDARGIAVRDVDGRILPRRALREALGRPPGPTATALATTLDRHQDQLHQLACDLTVHHDPMDLRALRAGSLLFEDPGLRALSAAAAARMHLRSFQASEALDLVRRSLAGLRLPHLARGLLRWVEGDALLIQGSDDLAHEAHLSAAADLRGAEGSSVRLAQARRCADAWVARGHRVRAQTWIGLARSELSREPNPSGLADTLRISGNLAAQAGELVGARALYDEALATIAPVSDAQQERAFIQVGLAALAMADRDFVEALEHLDAAARSATGHPMAEAAVAWRRAEIALRRGFREPAREALEVATRGFRRAGSLRGLLLCARMLGDLHAVAGDRKAAVEAWEQAMTLCVRTRNLAGLRRVLRRRLVVEREGLPGPHVGELQEYLDRAEVLLGVRS